MCQMMKLWEKKNHENKKKLGEGDKCHVEMRGKESGEEAPPFGKFGRDRIE